MEGLCVGGPSHYVGFVLSSKVDVARRTTELTMAHILLLRLTDVFHEVCQLVEEESGKPLTDELEQTIAHRIAQSAKEGERDLRKIKAYALTGLLPDEYSLERMLLN